MFDLVAKLLIQKQLKLEKEGVHLFNHRMAILPTFGFVELQKKLYDEKLPFLSYNVFKKVSMEWLKDFKKNFDSRGQDLLKWSENLSILTGWGEPKIIEQDLEKKHFIVELINSSIASTIVKEKGLVKKPVDHMFRGFLASAMSLYAGQELEAFEKECFANGFKKCVFEIKPLKDFDLRYQKVKEQFIFEE